MQKRQASTQKAIQSVAPMVFVTVILDTKSQNLVAAIHVSTIHQELFRVEKVSFHIVHDPKSRMGMVPSSKISCQVDG